MIEVNNRWRGRMLRRRSRVVIGATVIPAALLVALLLAFAGSAGSTRDGTRAHFSKFAASDPDSKADNPGLGPNSFEAYLSAERTYPANVISPAISEKAAKTFAKIAAKDAKVGDPKSKGQSWVQVGPQVNATQPGVLSFSGATNNTASRITALVVSPDC